METHGNIVTIKMISGFLVQVLSQHESEGFEKNKTDHKIPPIKKSQSSKP